MNDITKTHNKQPPIKVPRCFIIEEPSRFSVEAAYDYGEVVALFDLDELSTPMVMSKQFTAIVMSRLEEHNYNPLEDYIVLTGSLMPILLTVIAVILYRGVNIQVLMWEGGKYKCLNLDIAQIEIQQIKNTATNHYKTIL